MNKNTRDIKNSDEIEENLRHTLSEIIDFLPDATFIIDKHSKIIAWNTAIEELTGVKASEVIGKSSFDYSKPIYGDKRPILIDLALKSKKELDEIIKNYLSFERNGSTIKAETFVPYLKKGGLYIWAKARPLYNTQGKIIGAIETIRDITHQKLTERNLQERVKELNCLFQITKLLNNPNISVDEILVSTLENICCGFQFPDITCAKIVFNEKEFKTNNYEQTPWSLSHQAMIKEKKLLLEVKYLEDKPFLDEEKDLLEEIMGQLKVVLLYKLEWII
ncbi:MAG: PAS domain-containing protein [Promethearchaeota archaeon]